MNTTSATLLLICIICWANADLPEVHLDEEGNFVDVKGGFLLFHGFNSVYKKPPYFNAKDVSDTRLKFFQQWGFNVVRLGVLWHPTFPLGPGRVNDTYLKAIEDQVTRFAEAGIYVILDMHQDSLSTKYGSYDAVPLWLIECFPKPPSIFKYPWPKRTLPHGDWEGYVTYACQMTFQNIYDNICDAWKHWGDFWVEVATRFKDKSNVLGYELINEPFAGNIYTDPRRALPGYAGKHNLAPVYNYLARRIRSVDKRKFIFFEGVTWSVITMFSHDGIISPGFEHVPGGADDPHEHRRSVFSYHYYCTLIQFANMSKNFSAVPRMICDNVVLPAMFSSVRRIAHSLKSARFLTEFGICVPDGNPYSINTVECNAVMNAADAELQSWTYWDAQFFDEHDNPIIHQVKPFVRVYPMMTAGVPITLTFEAKDGTAFYAFSSNNLTASTAREGEPIASIFIPLEMHYSDGYKIEVNPNYIHYNASYNNNHVINLFAPRLGILEGVIIEVNIHAR